MPRPKSRAPIVLLLLLLVGGGAAAVYVMKIKGGTRPPATAGKPDRENLPPQIKSVVAKEKRVAPGASTALTATITDPERDPYYAWWTTSCGIVVPRSDAPGSATFLAPTTPGPCAITLEVQDHEMKRGRQVRYTIVVTGGA